MARLPGDPYRPDKPTRADVARAAGVSESTVSRALNDHPRISLAARERVKRIAGELGYVPNRAASMLAARRTKRIGLVIRSYSTFGPFTRAYFPRLLDGVLLRAEERNYTVTVLLDKKNGREKDLSQLIRSKEVDGLLFSVTPLEDARFYRLKKKGIPFVLINNQIDGMECINDNPMIGMEQAFKFMEKMKYNLIGYIGGDKTYHDGLERLNIFEHLSNKYNMESMVYQGDFSKTCGYKSGDFFFKKTTSPQCILSASDRSALGILHYCRERKISIPKDVGIIGYDDLGPARDSFPALTTINNPVKEMGSAAVDRLIDILEGKKDIMEEKKIETSFIQRNSTKKYI